MQPVDFSGREVIRFRTRGGGQYSEMLISSADPAGPPPTVTFFLTATPASHCGVGVCGGGAGRGVRASSWGSWR